MPAAPLHDPRTSPARPAPQAVESSEYQGAPVTAVGGYPLLVTNTVIGEVEERVKQVRRGGAGRGGAGRGRQGET